MREETSSSAVKIESVILSCFIDAKENRDVETCETTGTLMQVDMDETNIVSSVPTCINVPVMSHVSTSLFSLASMTQDRITDSVVTADELVSSLILYALFFSEHFIHFP